MSRESNVSGAQIGCLTVVGIVLLMLKILGIEPVANWSWIWVLCPFWAPVACLAVVGVVIGILAYIFSD